VDSVNDVDEIEEAVSDCLTELGCVACEQFSPSGQTPIGEYSLRYGAFGPSIVDQLVILLEA